MSQGAEEMASRSSVKSKLNFLIFSDDSVAGLQKHLKRRGEVFITARIDEASRLCAQIDFTCCFVNADTRTSEPLCKLLRDGPGDYYIILVADSAEEKMLVKYCANAVISKHPSRGDVDGLFPIKKELLEAEELLEQSPGPLPENRDAEILHIHAQDPQVYREAEETQVMPALALQEDEEEGPEQSGGLRLAVSDKRRNLGDFFSRSHRSAPEPEDEPEEAAVDAAGSRGGWRFAAAMTAIAIAAIAAFGISRVARSDRGTAGAYIATGKSISSSSDMHRWVMGEKNYTSLVTEINKETSKKSGSAGSAQTTAPQTPIATQEPAVSPTAPAQDSSTANSDAVPSDASRAAPAEPPPPQVANREPSVSISGPTQLLAGETGTYTASASDPDGDSVSYSWGSSSTSRSWSTPGLFSVSVTVTDSRGASSSASISVRVI